MEDINRLKVVLVEKKRTARWLSMQMGVNPSQCRWVLIHLQSASGVQTPLSLMLQVCLR